MKKKLILIFAALILLCITSTSITQAKVHPSGKIKKEIYASPEELLVDMLNPYISEIVRKECGETTEWRTERVQNLKLMVDHIGSETKSWYEVSLMLRTTNPKVNNNKWGIDTITLNIDPKTYFGSSDNLTKSNKDLTVKLVEYKHHHNHKLENNL